MLAKIGHLSYRRPKLLLAIALLIMIGAGVFGAPVSKSLSAGGYDDPKSQSFAARAILRDHFDRGTMDIVFEVIAPGGADSPGAKARGDEVEAALRKSGHARQIASYWSTPGPAASALKSKDGKTGIVFAEMDGTDAVAPQRGKDIADTIPTVKDGVKVLFGGSAALYDQVNSQSEKDLLKAEMVTIPLTGIVLLLVFGSLAAAALPLAVGLFAIVGTTAALRGLTMFTDVSIFAMNLTTVMGLALAIDYALFIVNRYREEMQNGSSREDAIVRTLSTAGRTVLFSALTVALSLAAMGVFPMYFLRSFAYAGVAVVALAACAAITIAPALIIIFGRRVENDRGRHRLGKQLEHTFWYRIASVVMRRPIPIALAVTALFLVVGAPFLKLHLGYPDDRLLPTKHSARVVGDDLRNNYAFNAQARVTIVLPEAANVTDGQISDYATALSKVDNVNVVSAPTGTFDNGRQVGPPVGLTGRSGSIAYLTLGTDVFPMSTDGEKNLSALHAVPAPGKTLFSGLAQWNRDNVNAIVNLLPLALGLIAISTFIVLFLFTGSIVLPIKALLMNMLSLTATFGAMVWVFQEGHLHALGTTATGSLVANMPVLMFCVSFGISMDYEVFLLSRIREEWMSSDRTSAANIHAVAVGLARTGRLVTAAAVIMAIVFAGLILSEVAMMKMFSLGLTLAVLADATLIRGLLVPAFMRLAGRANWWAPPPLAWLHRRFGLSDG